MRNVIQVISCCIMCVVCVGSNGFQVRFRAVYRVVLRCIWNERYLDSILC